MTSRGITYPIFVIVFLFYFPVCSHNLKGCIENHGELYHHGVVSSFLGLEEEKSGDYFGYFSTTCCDPREGGILTLYKWMGGFPQVVWSSLYHSADCPDGAEWILTNDQVKALCASCRKSARFFFLGNDLFVIPHVSIFSPDRRDWVYLRLRYLLTESSLKDIVC